MNVERKGLEQEGSATASDRLATMVAMLNQLGKNTALSESTRVKIGEQLRAMAVGILYSRSKRELTEVDEKLREWRNSSDPEEKGLGIALWNMLVATAVGLVSQKGTDGATIASRLIAARRG